MKIRTILYGIYLALSILISLTLAAIPGIMVFAWAYNNIEGFMNNLFWPISSIHPWFTGTFAGWFPSFFYEHFWFIVLFVPIGLTSYSIFLAILLGLFLLSRRGIPFLEDGYYNAETEKWLLYEFYEVYYILLPYFAGFFSIFTDTRFRHVWFGAEIGKGTVVGNGRLFNPERTIIGQNCFFGYDAILSGHVYEGNSLYLKTVKLGDNVTVGANAVILAGAEIGDNVVIGAASVVPKDTVVPDNTIWVRGKAIPRDEVERIPSLRAEGDERELPEPGEHI
ncbi:MAG: hypothetical protein GF309_00820 [Candidatus Lokiarchaeota archaeon]|nr:hypothetical protein [Candidatus Lokiarchaeota archaeon]